MASLDITFDSGLRPARAPGAPWEAPTQWRAAALPPVQPGQLWLAEFSEIAGPLRPEVRALITAANVVIYDRSLVSLVAGALPLGGYAEPAGAGDPNDDPQSIERSRRFARDGWSVVRLLDGSRETSTPAEFAARLEGDGIAGRTPVSVFRANGGGFEETTVRLAVLGSGRPIGKPAVILLPSVLTGSAPAFRAVAANGLAG